MTASVEALCASDPLVKHLIRVAQADNQSHADAAQEFIGLGLDKERVYAALDKIRAHAAAVQTAQEPRALVTRNGEPWYPGPNAHGKNWQTLVRILRESGMKESALRELDDASTKVVAHLPNPHSPRRYRCHGLVLGYVQSGKTTNFTAVIAKAADAGYRFFLVLGGVHNSLRQQTQDRLNAQLWERNPRLWFRLTDEDDFRPNANVDALLGARTDQRVLAVVKKNGTRLRALRRWLAEARPETLRSCPILIIDDEADQATINTARADRSPTTINRIIREIIDMIPKSAYVGYTATPFANVLIDPNDETDLYPRDFIISLPRPDKYIGPEAVFGREQLVFDPDGVVDDGHDFIREVPEDELEDLRPKGSKARYEFQPEVTPSLDSALRYFLLSTAARRVRGTGNRHATALVHTSQHVDVHRKTADAIEAHMEGLARRLAGRDPELLDELRKMWCEEVARVPPEDWDNTVVEWPDVAALLPTVADDLTVITDNSKSEVRLNFDDDHPRVIVAVGGNTLSRGLTLEGLAVSYFVRSASAYDTVLQMGRWFGYRDGYADLTRIWTTAEMAEWFHHLATVEQEIRFDIERYAETHETPRDFGPRIRSHPKLAITSAAKMRNARRAQQSYSGRRIQTILFEHRDADWLRDNIAAARALIEMAAAIREAPGPRGARILGRVPSADLEAFLRNYRFHENSRDLNGELIWDYIQGRLRERELTHFRVAVMGRATPSERLGTIDLGLPQPVNCINRARIPLIGGRSHADIKALMSTADRAVDLGLPEGEIPRSADAIARLRNLPADGGRGDGSGLLLIYPVSKDSVPMLQDRRGGPSREPLNAVEHVIGVGMVFPVTSSTSAAVDYYTADIRDLGVEEPEFPDEGDEPVDELESTP